MSDVFSYEQLQGILKGNQHFEVVDFPGVEGVSVALKVLSQYEVDLCWRDAELKFLRGAEFKKEDFRETMTFNKEVERQLLYRAVMQVPEAAEAPLNRFFPDSDAVGIISQDALALLIGKYNEIQEKFNPGTKITSPEDLERIFEEVKKKSAIGLYLNTLELVALIDFIVQNYDFSPKDNGSSSQPSSQEKTKLKKSISRVEVVQLD